MRLSRGALTPAAVFLIALFAVQLIPAYASPVQPGSQPSSSGTSSAQTVTPDYYLLGKLSGTTVSQSDRPRSATITGGFQYAATYYGARDLQSAYGAPALYQSGYTGRGETIAVIDAYGDPNIFQDLATFDRAFGLPPVNLTLIKVGPYDPATGVALGWDAETALDVEAAHTMAPYAHINLLIGANASNALFEAIKLVVQQKLGNVVTMSWGIGENSFGESGWSAAGFLNFPYVEYYFQLGAAAGITFLASSGDFGAFSGTTTVTAGWPSDSPFVTGVGGTTLFLAPGAGYSSLVNSSASYQGEEAWSVSPQYVGAQGVSSGGGYSSIFPRPYYQAGATASKTRAFPDVAADANPYTGMVIVLEGGYYVIGGTSLASPLWAGMVAVMDQYVGRNLGQLNPYLYSIYGDKAAYPSDFHGVDYGFNGEYSAGPGYNVVTGLGSPDLAKLAPDVKSQAQGLAIAVTTGTGPSSSAPTQYTVGNAITISATATSPSGVQLSTGSFTATIEDANGVIATVPLSGSGGTWTGKHVVSGVDRLGQWTITVSGSSGTKSGNGLAEVDVGNSIGVIVPVPYPFGPVVAPGLAFTIEVVVNTPGGAPINNGTLTAQLIYEGRTVSSVLLGYAGFGQYYSSDTLSPFQPQGSYTLLISGPGFAPVYTYLYVGEALTGVMITPDDTAIPSAAAGQQVTFLARAETSIGAGGFTSNITAKIYSLSGALMASTKLAPAPNKAQFGVFNFFRYQQANYTIPANLTQGFYRLQFVSSYSSPLILGTQYGNFTTGFYVSGPMLSYTLSTTGSVYEGQYVTTVAKVTDSKGTPVTSGVFLATFIPSGYAFEAYATDFYGYTSVPMVYSEAVHGWYARYQIPSVLTSPNAFVGNLLSLSSGPWTVYVSGESAAASNAITSTDYVNVLPYTYYTEALLDGSNVGTAPLVSVNGTGYSLASIAADSLEVRGVQITLSGVSIRNLTAVDSTVWLDNSRVTSLSVTNSTVVLAHGTKVTNVSPALPTMTVAGLSQPLTGTTSFTVSVTGRLLTNGSLTGTVDGSPLTFTSTTSSSGITAKGTINTASLPDGTHTLTLTAKQSDGLSSTVTTYFTVNTEGATISTLTYLLYVTAGIAVLALIVAMVAFRRRPSPAAMGPPPPPQV